MPTTRSGKTTSNDPLIRNMKHESISPPRFPFSGTPDYLKKPKQLITAEETAQKNPPREISKKTISNHVQQTKLRPDIVLD